MPLMQEDIRRHYEQAWKQSDEAGTEAALSYSNPVEDAVLYPIYQALLNQLRVRVEGGSVLDVGAGSGRWIRFFLERFRPEHLVGIDFTHASVELLSRRYEQTAGIRTGFRQADITQPGLDLAERFDLINVMNVLFHIPEQDRFMQAMRNLANHLADGGRLVTTEYMPRTNMRTNWMLVRSRYEFEAAAAAVGLKIVSIRAIGMFANDPMGIDGPDNGIRSHFHAVRQGITQIMSSPMNDDSKRFFVNHLANIERASLAFCAERLADVDMPSQKLVVLARA